MTGRCIFANIRKHDGIGILIFTQVVKSSFGLSFVVARGLGEHFVSPNPADRPPFTFDGRFFETHGGGGNIVGGESCASDGSASPGGRSVHLVIAEPDGSNVDRICVEFTAKSEQSHH